MNKISNIEEIYDEMVKEILNNQILIDLSKNGFSYFGVVQLELDMDYINPLIAGSYG